MNSTLFLSGMRFSVAIESDDTMRRPWDESDGHGPVREVTRDRYTGRLSKRPGERILYAGDRNEYSFAYDWQEAMRTARADGWGVSAEIRAKMEAEKGRALTPGEYAHAAVQHDFDFMRRWCADEWRYVGVVVTLLDVEGDATDETESLWGIESDSDEYLDETAHELAHTIADRVGKRRKFITEGARRIRVRA